MIVFKKNKIRLYIGFLVKLPVGATNYSNGSLTKNKRKYKKRKLTHRWLSTHCSGSLSEKKNKEKKEKRIVPLLPQHLNPPSFLSPSQSPKQPFANEHHFRPLLITIFNIIFSLTPPKTHLPSPHNNLAGKPQSSLPPSVSTAPSQIHKKTYPPFFSGHEPTASSMNRSRLSSSTFRRRNNRFTLPLWVTTTTGH